MPNLRNHQAAVLAVLAAGALSVLVALPALAQDADQRPQDPAPKTGPHAEHRQELAAALAEELNLDQSTVAAALDKVGEEQHAEGAHRHSGEEHGNGGHAHG